MVFESRKSFKSLNRGFSTQYGFGDPATRYALPNRSTRLTTGYWGDNNFESMSRIGRTPTGAYLNKFDWGHDFESTSMTIDESSLRYYNLSNPNPFNTGFSGYILPQSQVEMERNLLIEPSLADLKQALMGAGATAISRVTPTASTLDLSVTLGELRQEGLPHLPSLLSLRSLSEGYSLKSAASDYLNLQFGWKPVVQDIIGILRVVRESERIIAQYKRDSEKQVRRRYDFPTTVETVTKREGSKKTYPTPAISYYNCWDGNGSDRYLGELVQTVTRTTRTWFSGAFHYHVPDYPGFGGDVARWVREADLLLGTTPDIDMVWNLTKWSWLADWFVNFGDVLANISNLGKDNLTLRYGYIMRHTTQKIESELQGFNPMSNGMKMPSPTMTHYWNRKVRYHASPYGFGLNTGAFTPQQWSILAALGITMAPGRLFG